NPPNPNTPHFSAPDSDPPDFSALDFGALDPDALDFGALDPDALDFGALDPDALDFGALDPDALDFGALDFSALDPDAPAFGVFDFGVFDPGSLNAGTDSAIAESTPTREWHLGDAGPNDPTLNHHRPDPAFGLHPPPGLLARQNTTDSPHHDEARNLLTRYRVPEQPALPWINVIADLLAQRDFHAATAIAVMLAPH
ncbi:hypothetical protein ABZX92_45555, partial [Lentzea sp. NPDC006480]